MTEGCDDSTTQSTKTRWEWTGTIGAAMLLLTISTVVLVYVRRGAEVPMWASTTFALAVLTATVWTFGESALRAARGKE